MKDVETNKPAEVEETEVEETTVNEAEETETVEEVEKPKATKKTKPKKAEAKKVDEEPEADVEALKQQLDEANEKVKDIDALTLQVEAIKKDIESKDSIIKEYETLVENLISVKMKQVPAEYEDLIPDNLDLRQKLSWLEKAEEKGLFNKESKKKPNVEIGKPLNIEKAQVDTSKLTPSQLLKMAYSSMKK